MNTIHIDKERKERNRLAVIKAIGEMLNDLSDDVFYIKCVEVQRVILGYSEKEWKELEKCT